MSGNKIDQFFRRVIDTHIRNRRHVTSLSYARSLESHFSPQIEMAETTWIRAAAFLIETTHR